MVGAEHLPEGAVDVHGEVRHAAAGLAKIKARDVGFRDARIDFFHRKIGITRDEREGRLRKFLRAE